MARPILRSRWRRQQRAARLCARHRRVEPRAAHASEGCSNGGHATDDDELDFVVGEVADELSCPSRAVQAGRSASLGGDF
jgi:hypothetical protein